MPMQIDIVALFAAILLLIVVIYLVPMLIQVRNAAQRCDEFLREAQRDLLPMLRELRETTEHLNRAAGKVEEGMGKAAFLADSLEQVGESIHSVNSFLRHDVGRYAGNLASLWLGMRSASKVFLKQLVKEKGR
ncbi:MAG TPA: DUF948 domain-containing protein [Desulfuromonadales bacterium]|nr:DUF948 domain-containing protein [Desulfuromonadales bacterium]